MAFSHRNVNKPQLEPVARILDKKCEQTSLTMNQCGNRTTLAYHFHCCLAAVTQIRARWRCNMQGARFHNGVTHLFYFNHDIVQECVTYLLSLIGQTIIKLTYSSERHLVRSGKIRDDNMEMCVVNSLHLKT